VADQRWLPGKSFNIYWQFIFVHGIVIAESGIQSKIRKKMKRLGLMLAFVAIAATAVDANNYSFRQNGKTSKSQVKGQKPVKKTMKMKVSPTPQKEDPKLSKKK
jgi:hypothetical protein